MSPALRSYIAEFLGTFALVFIGTAVATLQSGPLGPYGSGGLVMISFAFGGTLMVLVHVIGPVSGCHVNPAVTLPMALSGRLPWGSLPGYLIFQCLGALAASGLLKTLLAGIPQEGFAAGFDMAKMGVGANGNPHKMASASLLLWEVVLTALFLFTIFAATRKDFQGSAPLAIGGFLFVAHLAGAQLGDSSLNPARSLGPAIVEGGDSLKIAWIFILGPLIGGVLGWGLYRLIYADRAD